MTTTFRRGLLAVNEGNFPNFAIGLRRPTRGFYLCFLWRGRRICWTKWVKNHA